MLKRTDVRVPDFLKYTEEKYGQAVRARAEAILSETGVLSFQPEVLLQEALADQKHSSAQTLKRSRNIRLKG
jgi:hypothetical protein